MDIDQSEKIAALEEQLQKLQQERRNFLLDRAVIALTTEVEIRSHGPELLDSLRSQFGITFCSSRFIMLSFCASHPDSAPDLQESCRIWTSLLSPRYEQLRNIILSVINLQHVGLTTDRGGSIEVIVNLNPSTEEGPEPVLDICRQINTLVSRQFGFPLRVSVSEEGAGIYSLPALRQQVEKLDKYRAAMEGHAAGALFYSAVVSGSSQQADFSDRKFEEYLSRGDFGSAKQCFLDGIIFDFVHSPPDPDAIRIRLSGLIEYLRLTLQACCEHLGLQEFFQEQKLDRLLLQCRDIQTLSDRTVEILDKLNSQWLETGSRQQLAVRARAWIDAHYMEAGLNLNTAAEKMGVTPVYLSRTFKTYYSCSVPDYIRDCRCAAAKRMMDGKCSMQHIAEQTGFGTSLNLSRAFKKLEGMTPTEYLAMNRQQGED